MGDAVRLKSMMIVALVVGSTPALAQEPHVMWRSAGSGTLAVDPLAGPGNGSQPPVVPTPPPLELAWPDRIVFKVGMAAAFTLPINNAVGPVHWQIRNGTLPAGIMLDVTAGKIIGYPPPGSAGTYVVDLMVTDSEGRVFARAIEIEVIAD